jgi:hypothetical protein
VASFPERTGDAWLAIAVADRFPGVGLWSPTQNVTRNWDLAVNPAGGKLLIFESKGCTSLVRGHSIRIDWDQLLAYVQGSDFADVRASVFYVLPSPPWAGDPSAAPVPPAAIARTTSPKGTFADWAFVISAQALYAYMSPKGYRSINTRQLPGSPAAWPAHRRGSVPGPPPTLRKFLNEVAECKHVDRITQGREGADRVPAVADDGDPFEWWVRRDEVAREPGEGSEDRRDGNVENDVWAAEDRGRPGAPSPVVAFIPEAVLGGGL